MKISIVVPVYNGEEFLEECLDSLINQTHKNIEIVIVNDASTDSTKQIIQKYIDKDSCVVYIENKENLNTYESVCVGFENSTGDYITCCDADDSFHPEACQILYNKALEHDADLVTSDRESFEKKATYILYPQDTDIMWANTSDNPHAVLDSFFISLRYKRNRTGALIKKDVVIKFLSYALRGIKSNQFEDWITSPILYFYSNKRVQIGHKISSYRCNPNSVIGRRNKKIILEYLSDITVYYQSNKYFFESVGVWNILKERFHRDTKLHIRSRLLVLPWYLFEAEELGEILNNWSNDTLKNIFIEELLEFLVTKNKLTGNKWCNFGQMSRKQKIKHIIKGILRKLGLKFIYEK